MERSEMLVRLKDQSQLVTFTKADGTTREMRCTLEESVLSKLDDFSVTTLSIPVKPNMDTIRVWDLDKESWRSFRVDSVTQFGDSSQMTMNALLT